MKFLRHSKRLVYALVCFPIFVASSASADSVRLIALAGASAPGTFESSSSGEPVHFNRFSGFPNASIPLVNDSGEVVFTAELAGSGAVSTTNRGIWRSSPQGALSLVARIGSGSWSPSPYTFSTLSGPQLSSDGTASFMGTLAGAGVTSSNMRSYWASSHGIPQLLVREGDSAVPLGAGLTMGLITNPLIFPGGIFHFTSALSGNGINSLNNKAIWVDQIGPNSPTAYIRSGTSIPEFPHLTAKSVFSTYSRSGEALLFASLLGEGIVEPPTLGGSPVVPNNQIIYSPGALAPIARAGDPAPGHIAGARFSTLFSETTRRPRINSNGSVLFSAGTVDHVGNPLYSGLFLHRAGRTQLIIRGGDSVPGYPAGVTVSVPVAGVPTSSFSYFLAEDDSVVFVSLLEGPGIGLFNNRAIFRRSIDGSLQRLAFGGQQAPGAPEGVVITNDSIARSWRVNGRGEIAFAANLSGPGVSHLNDVAFFVTFNGTLRMVAREGQEVPHSNGWVLSSTIPEPASYFNDQGQFLFPSNASGGPSGGGAAVGWFRSDENGDLRAVTLGSEEVRFENADALRLLSMNAASPISFSNDGTLVVSNQLLPGSSIGGTPVQGYAVLAISIRADQGTMGCPADFNHDGVLTVQDIFDFLTLYFASSSRADFNNDGLPTVQDVFDFLSAFFEGCP